MTAPPSRPPPSSTPGTSSATPPHPTASPVSASAGSCSPPRTTRPAPSPRATRATASSPPSTPRSSTRRTAPAGPGGPCGRTRRATGPRATPTAGRRGRWRPRAWRSTAGWSSRTTPASAPSIRDLRRQRLRRPLPVGTCIARPEVRAYLVDLAAEAARAAGARGTELESCGWYGMAHLHAHDKTGGVGLGDTAQYLMSLCFCGVCREGYASEGLAPDTLAAAVRAALEPVWAGGGRDRRGRAPRGGAARRPAPRRPPSPGAPRGRAPFQEAAVAAVRAARRAGVPRPAARRPCPVPHGCQPRRGPGAHPGRRRRSGPALHGRRREAVLRRSSRTPAPAPSWRPSFTVVTGMGGDPGRLARDARPRRRPRRHRTALYHAGWPRTRTWRASGALTAPLQGSARTADAAGLPAPPPRPARAAALPCAASGTA